MTFTLFVEQNVKILSIKKVEIEFNKKTEERIYGEANSTSVV